MKKAKDKAIRAGKEKLNDSCLKQFSRTYDIILQSGKPQNPFKKSTEKKRGRWIKA